MSLFLLQLNGGYLCSINWEDLHISYPASEEGAGEQEANIELCFLGSLAPHLLGAIQHL